VMHIALEFFSVDAVQLLLSGDLAEGGNREHLCLAAGEKSGTMCAGQQSDFGSQRADLVHAAAVHTFLVIQQPAAHYEFLRFVKALVNLSSLIGINGIETLVNRVVNRFQAGIADLFVVRVQCDADFIDGKRFDGGHHFIRRMRGRIHKLRLADLSLDLLNEGNDLLVRLVAGHDAVKHHFVGNTLRSGFDHGDTAGGGSHGDGHFALATLLGTRVDDVFAVHISDGNAADRASPRNIGNRKRDGGADHGGDLRRAVGIDRHHGAHHGHVVAHILGEQRADRAVDHAGSKDRLIGRAAFSALERARDLAHGIELLFKIDGKREEIHTLARFLAGGNGNVHDSIAVTDKGRSVCKLGDLSGFHHKRTAGKLGFKNPIVFKHFGTSVIF